MNKSDFILAPKPIRRCSLENIVIRKKSYRNLNNNTFQNTIANNFSNFRKDLLLETSEISARKEIITILSKLNYSVDITLNAIERPVNPLKTCIVENEVINEHC